MGRAKGLYDGMVKMDRNMQTWWNQFDELWGSYTERTQANPDLYCSDHESLLAELETLEEKIELVTFALILKSKIQFLSISFSHPKSRRLYRSRGNSHPRQAQFFSN